MKTCKRALSSNSNPCHSRVSLWRYGFFYIIIIRQWCTITPPSTKHHLYNVGPTSKTLGRRYTNVLCLLGMCMTCHISYLAMNIFSWQINTEIHYCRTPDYRCFEKPTVCNLFRLIFSPHHTLNRYYV